MQMAYLHILSGHLGVWFQRKGGLSMKSNCENCPIRKYAEKNPKAIISRIWRWHTTWCPGWKAYQAELAKLQGETRRN